MLIVSVVLGVVVSGLAIPFAGILGFAARSTSDGMDNLPTELETTALPQKTFILDSDGDVLATVFDENRINVSLDQINKKMVQALLSIEDYRFYEHGALDMKGTMRAFFTNAAASGVVQGGSTITQQLVKQTLLSQASTKEEKAAVTDDTYARKLRELRYAIALENRHSKDWILNRYLNIAYFGDGAYGVQAAARHYFNVNARKLSLNQAATLAGLVQNPSAFDPTDHKERAIERRDVVLNKMAQLNVITQEKADKVKARGLSLRVQPTSNGCVNSAAPFFCSYTMSYLEQDKALGKTVQERRQLLKSGGLTIKTTVDLFDQKAADEAVKNNVRATDQAIGALAMVEPGTGEVKAIAQSRPMGSKRKRGQTYLNYVVPSQYGDSNGFQAGSTFKVFVLATAIENGIALDKTFPAPNATEFEQGDFANCPGQPRFTGTFPMQNSVTSRGIENLYTGTRNSINTFFFNLEKQTGVCEPLRPRQEDGSSSHRSDREVREGRPAARLGGAGPQLHPGRGRRQPPGDGRGLRDLRCTWHPLRLPPGHPDLRREWRGAQEVPGSLHAGHGVLDRRCGQRHPARRDRQRLRLGPAAVGARRRQDRHHRHDEQVPVGVVRRLHPGALHRVDGRGRQRVRHPDRPGRPDDQRRHRQRLGLRPRRADLGSGDEGRRRPPRQRALRLSRRCPRRGPDLRPGAEAAAQA